MSRRLNRIYAAAAVAALIPVTARATEAVPYAHAVGADAAFRPAPLVRIATGCIGFCRAAYPPCRVGSRWYGPYGYVCYRPEPTTIVIR